MKYAEILIREDLKKLEERHADVASRGRILDEEYHNASRALDKESAEISQQMGELHALLKLMAPSVVNDEPSRKRYTEDEVLQLVTLRESGKTYTEIAQTLGRTKGSLSGKLHEFKYGKPIKKVQKRDSRKRVSLREKQEIKSCYMNGMGVVETARHLGRGVRTISRIYSQLKRSS